MSGDLRRMADSLERFIGAAETANFEPDELARLRLRLEAWRVRLREQESLRRRLTELPPDYIDAVLDAARLAYTAGLVRDGDLRDALALTGRLR